MHDTDRRRARLVAALGFLQVEWPGSRPNVVGTLACWLDSWRGLGDVVVGMKSQGFELELKEFPYGWRANFYATGVARSAVVGSADEPTPWRAVQLAGWRALHHTRAA